MSENKGLLSSGLGMVARNKRYIFWFWLLNLMLAWFGTTTFSASAHAVLDHSLTADRLVHGFDLPVMAELFTRPEFGQMAAMGPPESVLQLYSFWPPHYFSPESFRDTPPPTAFPAKISSAPAPATCGAISSCFSLPAS